MQHAAAQLAVCHEFQPAKMVTLVDVGISQPGHALPVRRQSAHSISGRRRGDSIFSVPGVCQQHVRHLFAWQHAAVQVAL